MAGGVDGSSGLVTAVARAQRAGLSLSQEALDVLGSLLAEDATELLEATVGKIGTLRDPSNYIVSTVARGYVSRRNGGGYDTSNRNASNALGMSTGQGGTPVFHTPGFQSALSGGPTTLAERAQAVALDLTEEAYAALATLPSDDSFELLEATIAKSSTLRDPSNYVISTVSRGYVSRRTGAASPVTDLGAVVANLTGLTGAGGAFSGASALGSILANVGAAGGVLLQPPALNGTGKGLGKGGHERMIPPDIAALEMKVLDMNSRNLWNGQQIDVATLLALRCIQEEHAIQILDAMEARSIGGGAISSPTNYIQAAVSKVLRGFPVLGSSATLASGGGAAGADLNRTGNLSANKARELGLDLSAEALQSLAAMPMREALRMLDDAAAVAMIGEDPSVHVLNAAILYSAGEFGDSGLLAPSAAKRTRFS